MLTPGNYGIKHTKRGESLDSLSNQGRVTALHDWAATHTPIKIKTTLKCWLALFPGLRPFELGRHPQYHVFAPETPH